MKNFIPSIFQAFGQFGKAAVAGFVLLSICSTSISAQGTASPAAPAAISTVDYEDNNWKSPSEYGAIVAAERMIATQKLGANGLPASKIALYTGYDRMLSYMESDLAANLPIGNIADSNQKRVLGEAPADPILQAIEEAAFNALSVLLVSKLVRQ